MSRRSFPRIDPDALRDHADEARIERVWERVERDLASRPRGLDGFDGGRSRRSTFAYVAVAAAFGAFGAGLLAGKVTWGGRAPETLVASPVPAIEKSEVDVLAAGSQPRSYPLRGGGQLTLLPGATVEVERSGEELTLKLVQGGASIETAGRRALAVLAGEAQINAAAGSTFNVTRNADDLDVGVDVGSVSVSSPAGAQQLARGERAAVPIHAAVASSAPVSAKPRRSPALSHQRPEGPKVAPKGANVPEWLARHNALDDEGALVLLRKQDVNALIASSKSAAELDAIAEIMRSKGRDPSAEIRACERLVQDFPHDQHATLAASRLADIYQARGESARAKSYKDKQATLAQSATTGAGSLFCDAIRRQPDKTKAALLAKEYLEKYPDGDCRDEFEQRYASPSAAPAPSADPAPPVTTGDAPKPPAAPPVPAP